MSVSLCDFVLVGLTRGSPPPVVMLEGPNLHKIGQDIEDVTACRDVSYRMDDGLRLALQSDSIWTTNIGTAHPATTDGTRLIARGLAI